MEIELRRDKCLCDHDTGGGMREIKTVITIDDCQSKRMKRHSAIYETLGACLSYSIPHEQLMELTEALMDIFDQLEPL